MLGEFVLENLKQKYEVIENPLGENAYMKKGLMHFHVRSFEVKDIGHLCLFDMKGMFGLMKMETIVFAVQTKDVPLLNMDVIQVPGKKTQMVEFYNTMIGSFDETDYLNIKKDYADVPNYESGAHWYDSILLPSSLAKTTKPNDNRTEEACKKYFALFLNDVEKANACSLDEKKGKIKDFAQGLLDHGGPAVDQVRKMFGEEKTKKLILDYMYGVD